ncbi:MAG: hypothetical protein FWB72_04545 [Firmicutes bacterium]|nr:hypothetical protein [Bacillota bacterium]
MKYINKDYGYEGRPPFRDDLYEVSPSGEALDATNFPLEYRVGVGFDYAAVNGALFVGKFGTIWGIRLSYHNGRKWVDYNEFAESLGDMKAGVYGKGFTHFNHDRVEMSFVKKSEQSMVISVKSRHKSATKVRLVCYPFFGDSGQLEIQGSVVKGHSPYIAIKRGQINFKDRMSIFRGRQQIICDEKAGLEHFLVLGYKEPQNTSDGFFGEVILEYSLERAEEILFYAIVGEEKTVLQQPPSKQDIKSTIDKARDEYSTTQILGRGKLAESVESLSKLLMWSRVYYPYLLQPIYVPNRANIDKHFALDGLRENSMALLSGILLDPEEAFSQLQYSVEDSTMSILSAWILYLRHRNKAKLEVFFNKQKKLLEPDGELAKELDRNPDTTVQIEKRLEYYPIGANCLKLMNLEIMYMISKVLDQRDERYKEAHTNLKRLINEHMWDEVNGYYSDITLGYKFIDNARATSFYALTAGVIEKEIRLKKTLENLKDNRTYGFNFPVLTMSKKNRRFFKNRKGNNRYNGGVTAYVNFLIYLGLLRYYRYADATALALKGIEVYERTKKRTGSLPEYYKPNLPIVPVVTNFIQKIMDNQVPINFDSCFLPLLGISEILDIEVFTYFENESRSIKFGTFAKGAHSLSNINLFGDKCDIKISDNETVLFANGQPVFTATGGRVVIRHLHETQNGCRFIINARTKKEITIMLKLPFFSTSTKKPYKMKFTVGAGATIVTIDDVIPYKQKVDRWHDSL